MGLRTVKDQLQAIGAAFQLLTRIPVPVSIPFTPQVLARSAVYFPLVGAVLGFALAAAGWLLSRLAPPMPGAVIMLLLWTVYSGALHLDGLMDTADGVLSHRSRERMLEIMKDSRVGAMGVVAAVLLMLFKFAALAALLESGRWGAVWPAIAAVCIWSRLWVAFAIVFWPFARAGEGLAGMFAEMKGRHAAGALAVHLLLLVVVCAVSGQPLAAGAAAFLIQAGIAAVCATVICVWLRRKLGGLTGDTYGALNEVLEAVLIFAVLWMK